MQTAEERAKQLNESNVGGINYSIGNGYQNQSTEPETSLIVNPVDFTNDDMHRILYITSVDMCKIINSVFAPMMKDYYGCILGCDEANPFAISLTLYFSKDGNKNAADGAISSLIPISDKATASNNAVERIQRFKQLNSTSKKWKLNQETQDILMSFVRPYDKVIDRKTGKEKLRNGRDMNAFLIEQVEQSGYGYGYNTTSIISGFDPMTVISKFYGITSPEGDPYEYRLQRLSPIYSNATNIRTLNYLMMLEQINRKRVDELFIKAGFASSLISQLPIVRV